VRQQREFQEACRKLKPVLGGGADELWASWNLADDREERAFAEQVAFVLNQRALQPTVDARAAPFPPPTGVAMDGRFNLGEAIYAGRSFGPLGIEASEIIQHVGIFGRSGSGKTNLVAGLLKSFVGQDVPFLVFDFKQNYRDLLADEWAKGVIVLTAGKPAAPFRFNPLIPPPGTSPRLWLGKISDAFKHAYWTGFGVEKFLREAIDHIYEEFGVYGDKPVERWPTFKDVQAYISQHPQRGGRKILWMDSIESRLEGLTFPEVMGEVTCSSETYDLAALLRRPVIVELDALKNADKAFLISTLLLWIHHYGLRRPGREQLRHVVVAEEAHHVLLKKRQAASGEESIIDQVLREIRELGHAVIIVDQHPSLLSQTALGNTFTTVTLNLKHAADIEALKQAALLTREQADHLGRLPVGHAVVKLQGRIPEAVLVQIPHAALRKGSVSDADLARRFRADSAQPGPIPRDAGGSGVIPAIPLGNKEGRDGDTRASALQDAIRDPPVERFLRDVAEHPWDGVVTRYRRLGLSARQGTKIKQRCLDAEVLVEERVRTGQGESVLLKLTPRARNLLGPKVPLENEHHEPKGRESLEHARAKAQLKAQLERAGFSVSEEKRLNGESVDLEIISRSGERIAVEVFTCKSHAEREITKTIEKCEAAGYRRLIFFATSIACGRELRASIKSEEHGIEMAVVDDGVG
jgi:hypothetical protein